MDSQNAARWLSLAALPYVLGYLSWALYALQRNIGVLPALDGQYFIAGLIPALALALLWGLWRIVSPGLREGRRRSYWMLAIAATVVVAAAIWLDTGGDRWLSVLAALAILAASFAGERSTYWPVATAVAVAAFYLYVDWVFPRVPPELGGARGQCVVLDLLPGQLSASTLQALGADAKTLQTEPLHLHYRGGGFVIARKPKAAFVRIAERSITAISSHNGC